ncbi:MAG: hypothetical protein Q610_ECBC00069G0001, partial [Escherichia coli DORA_B_14]
EDHKDNRARVAEAPLQFWHKLKVHAIAGGNPRRKKFPNR